MASVTTQAGIGIAIVGFLLLLVGAGTYGACSSSPASGAGACSAPLGLAVLGVVLLLVGVVIAVASYRSYTYIPPTMNPAVPPPLVTPVVIQQTVQQQVVRVRCRYCGTLGDPAEGRCPACGAPL